MSPSVGYLLPTREQIMEGRPQATPLLRLAERAEELGFDSVWVGDSLTSRPRHEPLTLLAGVAGRRRRIRKCLSHSRENTKAGDRGSPERAFQGVGLGQ